MHGAFLKMFIIVAVLFLGWLFLFWTGLLPASVYPAIYQFTDNLPLAEKASAPYLEKYEGHWTLAFTPTSRATTDGDCPSFATIATAHDGVFSAHTSIPGYTITLTGSAALNGLISGKFISSDDEYSGVFSGTIAGASGSGTWSDDLLCPGTWTLTKLSPSVDPVQAIASAITGRVELVRGGNSTDLVPEESLYAKDEIETPAGGQARIILGITQKIVDIAASTTYIVPDAGGMIAQ